MKIPASRVSPLAGRLIGLAVGLVGVGYVAGYALAGRAPATCPASKRWPIRARADQLGAASIYRPAR
ncbi:MAG: hypothetical protein U0800_15465 [Isosphaeraceae bacterium]